MKVKAFSRRLWKDQRGAALIVTLMAMVLMFSIIVEFSYSTRVDISMISNYRNAQQARYYSEVGVDAARILLLSDLERDTMAGRNIDFYAYDTPPGEEQQQGADSGMGGMGGFGDMMGGLPANLGEDGLQEIWSLMRPEMPAIPLGETGAMVKLNIRDEAGKVNLNMLDIPRGLESTNLLYLRFVNFFLACGLTEEEARQIIPRLLDWIDEDDQLTNGGAESQYYQQLNPGYMTRNRPLMSVEELRMVEGITPEIWAKISPYVTVYPRDKAGLAKINVNTAPAPVLQFLDPDMDETAAQAIIEERTVQPFRTMSEVQQVLSAYSAGDLFNRVLGSIDIKSDVFSVQSTAIVNGLEYPVYAVLQRNRIKKEMETLYWRSE